MTNSLPYAPAVDRAERDRPRKPLDLTSVRSQTAVVRSLLDELELIGSHPGAEFHLRDQLVDELKRLGTDILAAAGALERDSDEGGRNPRRRRGA